DGLVLEHLQFTLFRVQRYYVVETMQAEQPPKSTVLVLTALIAVIGGLGTAALFSNIEPSTKPWLVGFAYFLVTMLALVALGTMTSIGRKVKLGLFNNK